MAEQYSFIIPIATLKEKVEKHTSVLGKNRSAEGMPHLLEQYSLTDGESFLFDDYLREACAKTYNWIKAFGRNLSDAYTVYHGGAPTRIFENNHTRVTVDGFDAVLPNVKIPLADSAYSAVRNEALSTDEVSVYDVEITLPIIFVHMGDKSAIDYQIRVEYSTLADGLFGDNGNIEVSHGTFVNDAQVKRRLSFSIHVSQNGFNTVLNRINCVYLELVGVTAPLPRTYHKGEYIEYVYANNKSVFGIQTVTDSSINVSRWYDFDFRDSIIFNVELPDWMDKNMIPSAQEHIENALVNYIMYRWFETVHADTATLVHGQWRKQPSPADIYYAKWEEQAHEAQLALNSERRILQRKATWLQ